MQPDPSARARSAEGCLRAGPTLPPGTRARVYGVGQHPRIRRGLGGAGPWPATAQASLRCSRSMAASASLTVLANTAWAVAKSASATCT